MSSRNKKNIPIVSIAIGLMVATGTLLLIQDDRIFPEAVSRNNQVYFAEISTTSSPYLLGGVATSTLDVPILVYHIIRPAYADDSAGVRALAQTPEVFDAQMQAIKDEGYTVIPLADLENHLANAVPLPPKPIVITFDDGWRDQIEYAYPIIHKYGYPATFFVFTNSIGKRGFLSWDDLRALKDAGFTIGSHSRSHPYMTKLSDITRLQDEIVGSKSTLETNLGIPVTQFAYPFGQYTPAIAAMVRAAGYTSARGDAYSGKQSKEMLYTLSAVNTPTTLSSFTRAFP